MNTARLLIVCPDKPGIVAAITDFLYRSGANILDLDQHATDDDDNLFFMRVVFDAQHSPSELDSLNQAFEHEVAQKFHMQWKISFLAQKQKLAILVSKYDHVLLELLWRWSRQVLHADINMVISNHPDLEPAVRNFGLPFHHVPVTQDNKREAEAHMLRLLVDGQTDCIVLARYMQVLSENFVNEYPNKIINIHHSFLPSFMGANPYQQAYMSGVKLIGATAHYVTKELDMGPIIEQDVARVTHRDDIASLKELGQTLEKNVLARAVKWHLEEKIILHGKKTIIFS